MVETVLTALIAGDVSLLLLIYDLFLDVATIVVALYLIHQTASEAHVQSLANLSYKDKVYRIFRFWILLPLMISIGLIGLIGLKEMWLTLGMLGSIIAFYILAYRTPSVYSPDGSEGNIVNQYNFVKALQFTH